jgi:hypothetical protein
MTSEQKAWLDAHPSYHAIGTAGGLMSYRRRGTLLPDGRLVQQIKAHEQPPGAFNVGIRIVLQPGQMPDPRADMDRKVKI